MWTEDSNHGAQLQFHTGRHRVDGFFPTIGSWVHYGLGAINEDLPQFVVMGTPVADCCGGQENASCELSWSPIRRHSTASGSRQSAPLCEPPKGVSDSDQVREFALLRKLNQLTADRHPDDDAILLV